MRVEGLSGARRGKAFTITTHSDDRLHRPADVVARQFRAPAPDRLWLAALTYVKTHAGWVADNDIVASAGSEGDSFDNAMAESTNGLHKAGADLLARALAWSRRRRVRPMTYVDRFNHRRLHGEMTSDANYTTPAEAEADHYCQIFTVPETVTR